MWAGHGIPWGVKDLLDTAGVATTYGAEPFRTASPRLIRSWSRRLDRAGAVLVAKLSLGALALNDIWFGGQTVTPGALEEGASGSSAGPGPGPPRRRSWGFVLLCGGTRHIASGGVASTCGPGGVGGIWEQGSLTPTAQQQVLVRLEPVMRRVRDRWPGHG